MGDKCKGKTKTGKPCSKPAVPGLSGYCRWHYPPDGGGSKSKPDPSPKGGGDTKETVKLGLLILNTAKNVWDFIKEHLPDILLLTATQSSLFEKLTETKNAVERGEMLTQLLKSLTSAQMLQLVSALASHIPASKASQDRQLQIILTLVSLLAKPVERHGQRGDRVS